MPLPQSAIDQISAAMSISSLRNQVIANNIANRDTPGYQRLALTFQRTLDGPEQPWLVSDTESAAAPLERDLVDLSTNASHYAAMARVLGRYFSIIGAITSSRG